MYKINEKKTVDDTQALISKETKEVISSSGNNSSVKVWKVVLIGLSFFVGTIGFISILSMFLTGFK